MNPLLLKINKLFAYPFVGLIWLYQQTFSPDHGMLSPLFPYGYCRFHPTCSQYAKEALLKHGIFLGMVLTIRRLIKCHPWHAPEVDPVPELN